MVKLKFLAVHETLATRTGYGTGLPGFTLKLMTVKACYVLQMRLYTRLA
jgi:hypothetical protein